jgi:hypothetical protein
MYYTHQYDMMGSGDIQSHKHHVYFKQAADDQSADHE